MHHKWLDFGTTPDPENLQPHPGFVWVKSGYSETIAWRDVQLTKQRNVDLTTDGLWAMPLNTGWVPVKAHRLQDWEKLKKYVPIHKQGDVCPNGVPARVERGNNNEDDSDSEYSVVPRALPCLVHRPLCCSICQGGEIKAIRIFPHFSAFFPHFLPCQVFAYQRGDALYVCACLLVPSTL